MRSNPVDRLLIKLDGAAAPIWNSVILSLNSTYSENDWRNHVNNFISNYKFLNCIWNNENYSWKIKESQIQKIFCVVRTPISCSDLYKPINLEIDSPFRILFYKYNNSESIEIAFQIHHARGDGQSLIFLVKDFLDSISRQDIGIKIRAEYTKSPTLLALKSVITKSIFSTFRKSKFNFFKRGRSVYHGKKNIGKPFSITIKLNPISNSITSSAAVFFATITKFLENASLVNDKLPIRLRIPICLRRELGKRRCLGNPVTAIPIELDSQDILDCNKNPIFFGRNIIKKINAAVHNGDHWINTLETAFLASVPTKKKLRSALIDDLKGSARSSTFVTTYMGNLTHISQGRNFQLTNITTPIPVVGACGYLFDGSLYITFNSFSNLLDCERVSTLISSIEDWVCDSFGYEIEKTDIRNW